MASTSTKPASSVAFSSSSSSTQSPKQVFLSFRGDTRFGFTDALYNALVDRGLTVFRDKEVLPLGQKINPALVEAIKVSECAVIVISPEFATSKACLFELTVIMKYRRIGHFTVFPVFYHVNPGELERLLKDVENIFTKARDDPVAAAAALEKLAYWKSVLEENDLPASCKRALEEVSDLCALVVKEDSYETEEAKEFSLTIFRELTKNFKIIHKPLVGIDSPVTEIMKLINIEEKNISRVIGICGISGIGKSTLAEVIYIKIFHEFTHCCFIEKIGNNVEDNYLLGLQKQLICCFLGADATKHLITADQVRRVLQNNLRRIKAFIVLDDVWHRNQVDALAKSLGWFGLGSRIIITSRKRDLPHLGKNNVYEVKKLNENGALELLCQTAFNQRQPKEGFEKVAREIVECTGGLPFALVAFGSNLSRHQENLYYWESYQKFISEDRENILFITLSRVLDDLTRESPRSKELFLDIACYFNARLKNKISHILEALGYNVGIHLEVLEHYFLLKVSKDGRLLMHDLYVELGRQIAKSSRLLWKEDVIKVLNATTIGLNEYREVKDIVLKLSFREKRQLNLETLSAMTNLRMLWISFRDIYSLCFDYNDHRLPYLSEEELGLDCHDINDERLLPSQLGSELRIIGWWGCPLKILPLDDWNFTKLVVLKLWGSGIEQLCVKQKSFKELKVIDMGYSKRLITTPNLSEVPHLEILNLSGCEKLQTVHGSLKQIKKLWLCGCHGLTEFLVEISSKFLEVLNLSGCSKLTRIPNVQGELPSFRYLDISWTRIRELPFKSTSFPSLEEFYANYSDLRELPYGIAFAGKLRVLQISCNDSNTIKFPPSFSALSSLDSLTLTNCLQSNEEVPMGLGDLSSLLDLNLSYNKITKIPDGVCKFPKLNFLTLENCTKLELSEFRFENLTSLERLDLSCCNLSTFPKSIGSRSSSISSLKLANNCFTELPDSICELPRLKFLDLSDCTSLRLLPKLPLSLERLRISHCPLSAAFDSQRIKQISPELLQTKFCSSFVAYVGFDCIPHKILYTERKSFSVNSFSIRPMRVGCAPMREPRAFFGFIHGNIISNKKIEVRIDSKWRKRFNYNQPEICLLSIVYEVTGESSDTGACEGSNPEILPVFVCQLQVNETIAEQVPELASQSQPNEESPVSVVVRVPKVADFGSSYGVLVSMEIPDSIRRPKEEKINISDVSGESEQGESSIGKPKYKERKISDSSEESEPVKRWSLVASVTTSNERVMLKECGGHVFRGERGHCAKVVRVICRGGSDLKYLYHDFFTSMEVVGPIN